MLLRLLCHYKPLDSGREEFSLLEEDGELFLTFEGRRRGSIPVINGFTSSIIDQFSLTEDHLKLQVFFNTSRLEELLDQRRKIPEIYYDIFSMIYNVDSTEETYLSDHGLFYSLIKTSEYNENIRNDPLYTLDKSLAKSLETYLENLMRKISLKVFQKRNILWGLLKIKGQIKIQEAFSKYISFGNYFAINSSQFSYFRKGNSPTIVSKQEVPGGLIADEVGLGKTATAIGIAMADKHFGISKELPYKRLCGSEPAIKDFYDSHTISEKLNTDAVLIVVPTSKIKEWEYEIKKKVDKKAKILIIESDEDFNSKALKKYKSADYVIIGLSYINAKKMFQSILRGLQYAETEEDIINLEKKKTGKFWRSEAHLVREELSYLDNPDNVRSIPVTSINWRMVILDEAEIADEDKFLQHIFTKTLFVLSATPKPSVYSLFFEHREQYDKHGITRCNKRESLLDCDSSGVKITNVDLEYSNPDWYVDFMRRFVFVSQQVFDRGYRLSRGNRHFLGVARKTLFGEDMLDEFYFPELVNSHELPRSIHPRIIKIEGVYPKRIRSIKDVVKEFIFRLKKMKKLTGEEFVFTANRRIVDYLYDSGKRFLKKIKSDFPIYDFVTEFLQKFLEETEDEKIVVLAQKKEITYFTQVLPKNLIPCILRGTKKSKDNRLEKFKKDPNSRVLILFSEDCSGLNLEVANNILITYDAEEKEYRQVVGRSNRMNQEKSITVYRITQHKFSPSWESDEENPSTNIGGLIQQAIATSYRDNVGEVFQDLDASSLSDSD